MKDLTAGTFAGAAQLLVGHPFDIMLSDFFHVGSDRGMFKHVQVDSSICKMDCL